VRVDEVELEAKRLDGHLASFLRAEGELFIVSVNGTERMISQGVWRLLPEQEVPEPDLLHHLQHGRGRDGYDH
jgi:hypothetical protein